MSELLPLVQGLSTGVPGFDEEVPGTTTGPYIVIYGGLGTPSRRQLNGQSNSRQVFWRLLCVAESPIGARHLAEILVNHLDGTRMDGGVLTVPMVASPLKDPDDTAVNRWSVTVDVELIRSRNA